MLKTLWGNAVIIALMVFAAANFWWALALWIGMQAFSYGLLGFVTAHEGRKR